MLHMFLEQVKFSQLINKVSELMVHKGTELG